MTGDVTAKQILTAAAGRIARPEHWTREVYARHAGGAECQPEDAAAVCWCATGALYAAGEQLGAYVPGGRRRPAMVAAAEYNDMAEHGHIVALYERAIASVA